MSARQELDGSVSDDSAAALRQSVAVPLAPFRISSWWELRQPFIGLTFSAALGICCADRWPANLALCGALLVALAIAALWWRAAPLALVFVAGAFYLLHTFNFHLNAGRRLADEFGDAPRGVTVAGIVFDEPEEKAATAFNERNERHRFRLRLESITFDEHSRSSDAKVLVRWIGRAPRYGDRVTLSGLAKRISPTRNPGQFDYTAYLHRTGIYLEIAPRYPDDERIVDSGHGSPVIVFAQKTRRWMQDKLTLDLRDSPEVAGIIQSIVLGLKGETPADVKELFQRTGTLHLFVVNGLHVGMFAAIVAFLIRPARLGYTRSVLAIIPLLAFYALVTGLNPGSVRATVMAAIILGARLVERNPVTFNSLAAAAFVLLLWDTNELFMPAFQFSFGVVFSILLLAGRIQRFAAKLGAPDPFLPRLLWTPLQNFSFICWRRVALLFGVSVAAWVGSLPFTATYFHLFSPSAVIANLFVVPMAFAILSQGILAILCGTFSHGLATLFNNSNWLVAHAVLWTVRFFAQLPGGHLYVELPRAHAAPLCEITVFDLGAGASVHVRSARRDWLFDTGSAFSFENVVRPYLRTRGVNSLDGLLVSHGNSGHVGGALVALDDFSPREIADSPVRDRSPSRRALHAQLAARHIGKGIYQRGDWVLLLPAARARILYPPPGISVGSASDKALVLQLECGGSRVLFTWDSGFFTERWLMENEPDLKSDILVKGQHPSDISGTLDFIDAVAPQVIVCSVPERVQSLRPVFANAGITDEWARAVAARGIALFRQDQTGAVRIELQPDDFTVRAFLGDQSFRKRK
jgi:competence protein ComEC